MEINIDDEDFRERVRQMLRGRAPGQFRFCDDSDSEVRDAHKSGFSNAIEYYWSEYVCIK